MKNILKLLGIIALAAVIGFSMTACDGDGGGGGSAALGNKLELSGQVVEEKVSETSFGYQNFTGNLTITCPLGGTGKVTNGTLSYSIETPTSLLSSQNILEDFFEDYTNVSANPSAARGNVIESFSVPNGRLRRESYSYSGSQTNYSANGSQVIYVYADRDVTISGKGTTDTDTETEDGITYRYTSTTKDVNLAFKEGWNALRIQMTMSGTTSGTTVNMTFTETMTMGNPSLRWVYDDWSRYGDYSSNADIKAPIFSRYFNK